MKYLIYYFLIILSLTSCNFLAKKIFGISELKKFDQKKYSIFIQKIKNSKIDFQEFVADTSNLKNNLKLVNSKRWKKNLYQPCQILYFLNDSLIAFHANCFASQGLKVNWNKNNRFNSFIPESAVLIDSVDIGLLKFKENYILPISSNKKYTVLVFWSLMMESASKKEIETVFNNLIKFNKEEETNVYLINLDKVYSQIYYQ